MGCSGTKNKEGECGPEGNSDKEKHDPNFDGPLAKRSCTDILMIFVFIAFFVGVAYIAYRGYETGDPYRVLYGLDSYGNTCNRENVNISGAPYSGQDTTGLKYRYYWDPVALANPLTSSVIVCTSACPNETISNDVELNNWHSASDASLCRYDVDPLDVGSADSGSCPSYDIEQTIQILSFCIPESTMNLGQSMMEQAVDNADTVVNSVGVIHAQCANSQSFVKNVVQDIQSAWKEILYLCAISIGVSFIFTMLLRFVAGIFIWLSVILCAVGALVGAAFCWYTWNKYNTALKNIPESNRMAADTKKVQQWFYLGIAASIVAAIVLLVLLAMRKKIALVVQLFKEAGKAIAKMPLLLLQPLWTMLALTFFVGGLLAIYSYVHTSGLPAVINNVTVKYEEEPMMFYMKWYYLLGMFWIAEFIFACQQLIIAGAVAKWFFTRDKSQLGRPISVATKRLIVYHLGSIAFGSLLVALVQLVRVILAYIQGRLRGKSSKPLQYLLKCLSCFMWCFEKVIKFINKNAYIMIAIYGTNFCKSAQKALVVIVGEALRVGAINSVGAFCLILAKIGVSAIVMTIGLFFLKGNNELCYMFVPLVCAGAFAFAIAHCFLTVYSMAIDTIFMCFCEDCSRNDGINSPYFMSKNLMNYVANSGEAMAALEAREKAAKA